ncbi:MAG: lamin tail domain-containing protein [bacterium]
MKNVKSKEGRGKSKKLKRFILHALLFTLPALLFTLPALHFPLYAAGGVVINEFVYDADGTDTGYEWLELYNNRSEPVDITGWKIQKYYSEAWKDLMTISVSTSIKAKSYFLLCQSKSFFRYGGDFKYSDSNTDSDHTMSNTAPQTLRLIDGLGNIMDAVAYAETETGNIPADVIDQVKTSALKATSGASLTRDPDGEDTDNNFADFYVNAFPTPRSSGYGSYREEGMCYAAPNPFRPASGSCRIIAPEDIGTLNASIEIYDLSGMLVVTLTGTNEWDGKNTSGDFVSTGSYFIVYDTMKGRAKGKMTILR